MTSSDRVTRRNAHPALCGLAALAVAATALLASGPALAGAPRVVKGPYLTELDDHGVAVRFQLEGAPTAVIRVVRDDGAGDAKTFTSASVSGVQIARVTGLEPATRYGYSVQVGGAAVGAGHFSTGQPPKSTAPTTFLIYGDNRTDDATHAAVVGAIAAVPSDFLVQTGDMVAYGGSEAEWQRFFDIERALLVDRPIFAAIGNHELIDDAAGAAFARYFAPFDPAAHAPPPPYSTARVGNVRLFLLNSMHEWQGSEERAWLDRALAQSDAEGDAVWRIAVVHQGLWSAGPHGPNKQLVDAHLPELLAAHKVDLLISGHDHDYERGSAQLKYLISGGGGAPLYPVHATATTRKVESVHHFVSVTAEARTFRIEAKRIDGSVIERCAFTRGGPWDCDSPPSTDGTPPPGAAGPAAPAPPAPPPPAPNPSRSSFCACAAPGLSDSSGAWAGVGLGVVVLAAGRRSRRRG
jgi:calcineurin-like phosphoesterase family protein